MSLEKIKQTNKKIHIGDLISNDFKITLHNCENKENLKKILKELKQKGMPNYFGPQRFGLNKDNHIKGKRILKNRMKINENKEMIKFYIHAYQSYLFNQVLNKYIEKNQKPDFKEVSLVGSGSRINNDSVKEILEDEGIKTKDFELEQFRNIKCIGSKRQLFVKVKNIEYKENEKIELNFTLPKGSYATILLREVNKKEKFI